MPVLYEASYEEVRGCSMRDKTPEFEDDLWWRLAALAFDVKLTSEEKKLLEEANLLTSQMRMHKMTPEMRRVVEKHDGPISELTAAWLQARNVKLSPEKEGLLDEAKRLIYQGRQNRLSPEMLAVYEEYMKPLREMAEAWLRDHEKQQI